jgi:hypothetical protein
MELKGLVLEGLGVPQVLEMLGVLEVLRVQWCPECQECWCRR